MLAWPCGPRPSSLKAGDDKLGQRCEQCITSRIGTEGRPEKSRDEDDPLPRDSLAPSRAFMSEWPANGDKRTNCTTAAREIPASIRASPGNVLYALGRAPNRTFGSREERVSLATIRRVVKSI